MLIRSKNPRKADIITYTPDGLVRAQGMDEGIWSARIDGDECRIFHAQKTDDIDLQNHIERESGNNGWTIDRSMRKIASIPALEFAKHPEFTQDEATLKKWLKKEGRRYLSVKGGI